MAVLQTAEQADISIKTAFTNENVVLEWLRRHPGISVRDIATGAGWLSEAGKPHVGKVQRLLASLNHLKLARKWRGKWKITPSPARPNWPGKKVSGYVTISAPNDTVDDTL